MNLIIIVWIWICRMVVGFVKSLCCSMGPETEPKIMSPPMASATGCVASSVSRPAQAKVGHARSHRTESADAPGGVPDNCASLQSAVETHAADDGRKKLRRRNAQETPLSDPRSQEKTEASRPPPDAAQSGVGLRSPGEYGSTGAPASGAGHPRSCESGLSQIAAAAGQILVDVGAGTGSGRETVWTSAVLANR